MFHQHDVAVSARGHQTGKGRLQIGVGEVVGAHMALDVVDGHQRQVARVGKRLA